MRVKPGDTIVASTVDAGGMDHMGNQIAPEMRQSNPDTVYSGSNPLTGPFYVEGAELGDTINVYIVKIKLNRASAWSRVASNFGGLTEEAPGRRLLYNESIPTTRYEWSLDLDALTGKTSLPGSRLSDPVVPLHPFIGSIGVAPRYGRVEMSLHL